VPQKKLALDDHILDLNSFDAKEQDLKDKVHEMLQARMEIDHVTGCWIYTGAWEENGQAKMRIGRKVYGVHRVAAWLYFAGYDLWDVTRIAHDCQSPACFNPEHLVILQDQADCIAYQAARGRLGDRPHRRLTRKKAQEIRALGLAGIEHGIIARQFGISVQAVRAVVANRTWVEK